MSRTKEEILSSLESEDRLVIENELRKVSNDQNLLKVLLDHIPDFIYFKNKKREFVQASQSFCKLLNLSIDQIIGKKDEDLFPEGVYEQSVKEELYIIKTGDSLIDKLDFGEVSGIKHWVLTTKLPWHDHEGKIIGLFGFSKEITSLKLKEEELKKTINFNKKLIDTIPDTLLISDKEGNYLKLIPGKRFKPLVPVEELIGKNIKDVVPEETAKKTLQAYEKAFQTGEIQSYDTSIFKENKKLYYRVRVIPLNSNEVLSLIQDITKRTEIEIELQWGQKHLSNAQKIANLGSMYFDIKTQKIFWSDEVFDIFGLDKNEDKPQKETYFKHVHPEDIRKVQKYVQSIVKNTKNDEIEHRIVLNDGAIRIVKNNTFVQFSEKENIHIIETTIQDVTDQKNKELELADALRKVELANASKNNFFKIISHDLKSQIGGLTSLFKLINEGFVEKDDKIMETIFTSTNVTYKLLNNLLTWANSQNENFRLELSNCILAEIIFESISEVKLLAEQKSINIQCKMPEIQTVFVDAKALASVFRNILTNSIKFTHNKGQIDIETQTEESHIAVFIKDNGLGMSKETSEKLFKVGEQILSAEGTNKEKGTGLGLLICKEFIEKMDGNIEIQSELNQGTTVKITLQKYQ